MNIDEEIIFPEPSIDKKLKRAQSLVGTSKGRPDNDYYKTPSNATEALLKVEQFDGTILEPACGNGAISKILCDKGYNVISTDLIDRNYGIGGIDFLCNDYVYSADNIITNPPF